MTTELTPTGESSRADTRPGTRLVAVGALALCALSFVAPPRFFPPAVRACAWGTVLCFAPAVALAWLPSLGAARAWLARVLFASSGPRFYGALFVSSFVLYALTARFVFKAVPCLDDGVASLFQARIFARGQVVLPLPADTQFVRIFGVLDRGAGLGHWCGMYPPGWPLLLVPGVWAGAPWLVNPVLGAALIVCAGRVGTMLLGRAAGRTGALLLFASPLMIELSALHLSHVATALFCCLCLGCLRHMLATGRWLFGLLAGVSWGVAFLCRPLTALVVGAALGLAHLCAGRALLRNWRGILAAALAAAAAAAALAAFQHATTGSALTAGHQVGMGARGHFGLGRLDAARTHTLAQAARYTLVRLRDTNHKLLGWPLPSLLVVLLPFVLRRARCEHAMLIAPFMALLAVYAFYWYYEVYFPPRYLFAAMPLLALAAGDGLRMLARDGPAGPRGGRVATALAAGSVLYLAAIGTPAHLARFGSAYGDVEYVLPRVIRDYGITNAVVCMDAVGRGGNPVDPANDFYATGFMRNDLDLSGDVVFARNRQDDNRLLLTPYSGRSFYHYRYDRGTGKAWLYRMPVENGDFRYVPVPPRTADLLPPPSR